MPVRIGKVTAENRTFDPNTLSWQAMTQPTVNTDTLTVSMAGIATESGLAAVKANTDKIALTPASGSVTGVGNNTLLTPASGKKLRVSYVSYNPALAVEAAFRFGASGAPFLRNSIAAGGVVAKDFGDLRYIEGGVNEPLVLNLSVGVSTLWNAFYIEV